MAISAQKMKRPTGADAPGQPDEQPLDLAGDLVALLDADGIITSISPTITLLLGYPPDAIVGRSLHALVHPDDDALLRQLLHAIGQTAESSRGAHYRLRAHDGSWRWFAATATPLLQGSGRGPIVVTQRALSPRERGPQAHASARGASEHFVQFYESDDFLITSLADYVRAGLEAGDACVVIATPAHRESLEQRLLADGLDLAAARTRGAYLPRDASATLAKILRGDMPAPERFASVVSGVLARAAKGGRRIRVFGEMVALLWAEGNQTAAIHLEALWNELQATTPQPFVLFCGYAMHGFVGEAQRSAFAEVCHQHARVIPHERYTTLSTSDERLRAISLLQQKAASLEAEIASRTRTEERLRAAERAAAAQARHLEAVIEAVPDALSIHDATGRILRLNAAGQRSAGSGRGHEALDELPHVYDLRTPDGAPFSTDDQPVARALRGEVVTAMEMHAHQLADAHDTEPHIILVSAAPLRDADGQIEGVVTLTHDVTERRQLELRTREALEALLAMAETLVSVPAADPSHAVATARPEVPDLATVARRLAELTRRVLGCERVSLTTLEPESRQTRPLAVVGLAPEQEHLWWNTIPTLQPTDYLDELSAHRLLAGEPVVLTFATRPNSARPSYGAEKTLMVPMRLRGQYIGTLTAGYGVTPHEYTTEEIALAGAVAQLTALVIDRERLLRDREAARANEMALREANRRLDEFISVAGHELRTPLTSSKINVQLAERQLQRLVAATSGRARGHAATGDPNSDLARLSDLFSRVGRQMDRQQRLVDDLLDLSRIQAGKLDLSVAPCDLALIIREAIEEQRLMHPTRMLSVVLPAHREAVPLLADADRVGQVVTNYLTNALKYSPDHQPVIVCLEVDDATARVSVRDRGPGLPPEEQDAVWQRFHRVHGIQVQSGSGVGLGLGLYISRTIIERHGGAVGVDSTPGHGSSFWFTLPLTPAGT
ncbi:MAG: MEDS domain-containing protein [Ktedonobacterales bacterium]|nr:MEDS domain-containing protein [Ktedonobacterales bacterium]